MTMTSAFCPDRAAAHRGEGVATSPFIDVPNESVKWYDTDHGIWRAGHDLGCTEPGGLLWFEQPDRAAGSEE